MAIDDGFTFDDSTCKWHLIAVSAFLSADLVTRQPPSDARLDSSAVMANVGSLCLSLPGNQHGAASSGTTPLHDYWLVTCHLPQHVGVCPGLWHILPTE